jgi:GR25 family glycosyltransferase involved in LPS biosynthesis
MEYIDNIYVINMKRSKKRLRKINKNLKKLKIPFKRIEAVDGKNLTKDDIRNNCTLYSQIFSPLSLIGCFLSHKKAWKTMIDNNDKYAIIMEDDCELIHSFKLDLKKILDELIPHNPDFVYLGHILLLPRINQFIDTSNFKYSYSPKHESMVGFHCYIISNTCAKQLLQVMDKVDDHVDVSFTNYVNDFNVYASKKKIAYQSATANQSTQVKFEFPITLNSIFEKILSKYNVSYSYYLSAPLIEILWHPINAYLLIACLIALFIPDIYLFLTFFIIEIILLPKNITIISFWLSIISFIIYLRT